MKYAISLLGIVLLAGCASSTNPMTSSTANAVQLHLAQVGSNADTYYFAGPVPLTYQLTVTNPTNQQLRLRRLNLSTIGPGSYALRTGDAPMDYTIAPNGETTISLSAWGRSTGGFLRGGEPVTIRGMAWFDSPNGSFVRQFNEYIPQM